MKKKIYIYIYIYLDLLIKHNINNQNLIVLEFIN